MATVSVDKQILEEYTWSSYPYETWKGDTATTWGSAYKSVVAIEVDEDHISFSANGSVPKTIDSFGVTFANAAGTFADYADSTSDKFYVNVRKTFSHNISLTDAFSRIVAYVLNIKDKIDVDETYWDNIKFFLQFSENIKPRDSFTKSYAVNHLEAFKVSEFETKQINKIVIEFVEYASWGGYIPETWDADPDATWRADKGFLHIGDEMLTENEYYRNFNEAFVAKEICNKEVSHDVIEDAFYIDDSISKENTINKSETMPSIADAMRRSAIFRRNIQDGIGVSDLAIKKPNKVNKETITTKDIILRASNAVLSDIYVSEKLYSDDDFKDTVNTMNGYTPFIDFKVGEYQYKDAMVRVILQSDSQAEPTAQGITMHVDIPDTDDRGTVSITNAADARYVQFNKHYYTIPEVQVTLRGGSSSSGNITPHIVSIDTHGFYVELLNASGRTTGIISWVSKGY